MCLLQVAARTYRRRVARDDDSEEPASAASRNGSSSSSNGSSSRPSTVVSAESMRPNRQFSGPSTGSGQGDAGAPQAAPDQGNGQRLRKGRGSVPATPQKERKGSLNRLERDLREEIDAW